MDLQIDEFYEDACRALLTLYRAFPRKTTLYLDELIGYREPDDYGLPCPRQQSCLGALLWLGEEGYLRHGGTIRHEALEQAVLSEKGFLRLSTRLTDDLPPSHDCSPRERRLHATLARQLQNALNAGDSERLAELARRLLENPARSTSDTV